MSRSLLFVQLATTLPLCGLIWTIQIVHYPLFSAVGNDAFSAYHIEHSRSISLVVVPLYLYKFYAPEVKRTPEAASTSRWGLVSRS